MHRPLLFCFLILGMTGATASQAQELPLDVDLDYATFLYDDTESVLELYLSLGAEKLEYVLTEGRYLASVPLDIRLLPVAGNAPPGANSEPVLNEDLVLRFAAFDTSALIPGQFYVEQLRMAVPAGEYTLDATFPSTERRSEMTVALDIVVPNYAEPEKVMVSDVMLASHISRSDESDASSSFHKNGLLITPNPNSLFGQDQDRVYYYLETYGLSDQSIGDEYTLLAFLSRSNLQQPLAGFQERTVRTVRDPDVLVGSFDISELPSGSYFLRFALLDDNNEAIAEQTKKIFVLNPGIAREVVAVDEDFEKSLYSVMDEEEVDENLEQAKVIATQPEIREINNLAELDAKREYLARFWHSRDTDSDPATNAARREFYERLHYAEDRYDTPFEDVWETDRARVLLKYGYPSEVDPNTFDAELAPYEIWTYDNIPGEGTSIFVFADREGLSRYDLIHSTVSGETSDPYWLDQLRR